MKFLINLSIVIVLILGSLASMYFWIGVPRVYEMDQPEFGAPHLFGDKTRSLEKIIVDAFYFAPKNKKDAAAGNWRELLEENLAKVKKFHELQFINRSRLGYRVYPEIVIGSKTSAEYDTESTSGGNPRALINIAHELEERQLTAEETKSAYRVLFIMYEGVGAAGGIIFESERETPAKIAAELGLPEEMVFVVGLEGVDGFFMLNREFLSGVESAFGESLLAHEFYHALGATDLYLKDNAVSAPGIMGLGRLRPLERGYLDKLTLKEMGL